MPFLNDEVKEWIAMELASLGVEDLAVYALEAGTEGDERRVIVATGDSQSSIHLATYLNAVHPRDPDTAWFVPAIKDAVRVTESGAPFLLEIVVKEGYDFSRYPLEGL